MPTRATLAASWTSAALGTKSTPRRTIKMTLRPVISTPGLRTRSDRAPGWYAPRLVLEASRARSTNGASVARLGPRERDVGQPSRGDSFDHVVRSHQQRLRHREAERLRRLEVDHQLELRRLL